MSISTEKKIGKVTAFFLLLFFAAYNPVNGKEIVKPVVRDVGLIFRYHIYITLTDFDKVSRHLYDLDPVAGMKYDVPGGNTAIVDVTCLLFTAVDINVTVFVEVFTVYENVVSDVCNA